MQEKIILGIDPGSNITGYGLIYINENKLKLMSAGIFNVSTDGDHFIKLRNIFNDVLHLIDEYHPDELAIEEPFYGKNVQSMLKLGRAQGVAIAASLYRSVPVTGYSPRKIKQSITGKGNASKEQVAEMLRNILSFDHEVKFLDSTDALAVAVCHYFQGNKISDQKKSYSGWKAFTQINPERVT